MVDKNLVKSKGRIKGNSRTEYIRPSTVILSKTEYPVETLFSMWHGSRHETEIEPIDVSLILGAENESDLNKFDLSSITDYIIDSYPEHAKGDSRLEKVKSVINNLVVMVMKANLPPSESVLFNIRIDDATVAFREQLVRGKNQQFWTQTSRTADLQSVDVNMSQSIASYGGDEAVKVYNDTVDSIRDAYTKLGELGIPVEDIRLVPQGMTHRVYWMISLRTLLTIIPKRTSWIAQATFWQPIIEDLNTELMDISPLFGSMFGTPLDIKIKDGKVISHSYDNENEDRYYERDPQSTDPTWLAYKGLTMPEHTNIEFYDNMKNMYINMWSQEVCDILGWDKDDPDKVGPYDRPYSWFEENGRLDEIEGLSTSL